jgi:hypothetical protein
MCPGLHAQEPPQPYRVCLSEDLMLVKADVADSLAFLKTPRHEVRLANALANARAEVLCVWPKY